MKRLTGLTALLLRGLLLFTVAQAAYAHREVTTYAGGGTGGDGGAATSAQLGDPADVAVDASGNVYVADARANRVRRIDANGIITTVAGDGNRGYAGDGGPATAAELDNPVGLALDAAGDLYIADNGNARIRKVDAGGIITTVAGNGTAGFSGDGGPATSAMLDHPSDLAVDAAGGLYIADTGNDRIRKVDAAGIITTVAGGGSGGQGSGDGGPATAARLHNPSGIALDAAGDLYIADTLNNRIRKVDTGGVITTVAGAGGFSQFDGDGGDARQAHLGWPGKIAVDHAGALYIADTYNDRIRVVGTDGHISTLAGNGHHDYEGDGGWAEDAGFQNPYAVDVDGDGNVYVGDTFDHRVRCIHHDDTYTLTIDVAGSGSGTVTGAGTYNADQSATVTAAAATGSTFAGWSGPDASECAAGTVVMSSDKSCTATFTLNSYTLTLLTAGSGSGTVSGGGSYAYGTAVPVSQAAAGDSTFTGWTGADAAECAGGTVAMTADKTCTANFSLQTYTLTITASGNGSGSVSGAGTYTAGQTATVTPTPDTGSSFAGWSGADAAECGTGSVVMNADKACTAAFTLNSYTLTVSGVGSGHGTVSGGGSYLYGDTAVVSATPAVGSTFDGWTGTDGAECATGHVAITGDKSCTATFTQITYDLTIDTAGNGAGTVQGAGTYDYGTTASPVSAVAAPGSTFAGWSGPDAAECGGGAVVMDADKSCTATFTLNQYTLTLDTAGGGQGHVSGGGTYDYGTVVNVAATADNDNVFAGWSGPDADECASGSVTMDADKSCTATFSIGPDTVAPVITPPADILIAATSASGALVTYPAATATDNRDPSPVITYSQASGTIFPIGTNTVTVTATDASGNASTATFTITVQSTASTTATVAPARIYISNVVMNGFPYPSQLVVLDPVTNSQVGTIPLSGNPQQMLAHPGGNILYVVDGMDMALIDVKSDTEVNRLVNVAGTDPTVSQFQQLALSKDGNRLYLVYRVFPTTDLAVKVFDTSNPTSPVLLTTVTSPVLTNCYGPIGEAVRPDGSKLYLACKGISPAVGDSFFIMDTGTGTVTQTANFVRDTANYTFTDSLTVDSTGARVYLAYDNSNGSSMMMFDGATGAPLGAIPLPTNALPRTSSVSLDGTKLYVTDTRLGVHVIDLATNTYLFTMPKTGAHGQGLDMAMNVDGIHLYCILTNQLTVMDTVTNNWDATITGDFGGAYHVAITPGGRM